MNIINELFSFLSFCILKRGDDANSTDSLFIYNTNANNITVIIIIITCSSCNKEWMVFNGNKSPKGLSAKTFGCHP